MIKTIPRQAYTDMGDAIGVLRNGILVFESPDITSVMADCCLYEWYEDGKNLVQRYAEDHRTAPGTDESYLLDAFQSAKYRILDVRNSLPGFGMDCQDILSGDDLFVMDVALSQTVGTGGIGLATRTIPLGQYWMTGGAGLPIQGSEQVDALKQIRLHEPRDFEGPGSIALPIVRACLASGAADYVGYTSGPFKRSEPRHQFKRRKH